MKEKKETVAAALRYNPGEDQAPKVVAVGKGDLAKAIERLAGEHHIPLYRDETLAHALKELGLGKEIPPELYEAVAKILAHVAILDKKMLK